ncbi:amino acid adenylation domain-containing protein [Chitinophaga oryzae]|uniref:Amino acid adenylation domain-containing protein n=1 Tax=Chitinophaga oryzae TaxID=2725414 RepID=A0ABX6LGR2_9BACT|nr:non-ribosomal peptide synthetase [Chitinophaga oryzae]QJB39313.1 amino acid adenylation domain-containing protein [Chitinophaga oryzae]
MNTVYNNQEGKEAELYWIRKLVKLPLQPGMLPACKKETLQQVTVALPDTVFSAIVEKFGKGRETGRFLLYVSALGMLYERYTGVADPIIATPAFRGHTMPEEGGLLFLRTPVAGEETVRSYIKAMQAELMKSLQYAKYDFASFYSRYLLNQGESDNLCNIGVYYNQVNYPFDEGPPFLLRLLIDEQPGRAMLTFEYDGDTLSGQLLHLLSTNFVYLLELILGNMEKAVGALQLLPEAHTAMIKRFSGPRCIYPLDKCVTALFLDKVSSQPDSIAVEFEDVFLTYRKLDQLSDNLAEKLATTKGYQPGCMIGMSLGQSEMLAIATMAILKCGGVFVPIDPSMPSQRKLAILEDSALSILITDSEGAEVAAGAPNCTVLTPETGELNLPVSFECVDPPLDSAAFVVYTSGSTGRPKGIIQTHKCLLNVVVQQALFGGLENGLRVLQYSSIGFDVFVAHELFFSLLSGGTLCIISEKEKYNLERMKRMLHTRQIEWLLLPGSVLNLLSESAALFAESSALKHIVSAGEQLALSGTLRNQLANNRKTWLHNFYGPSETHNASNYSLATKDLNTTRIPIGVPAVNTRIEILQPSMRPAPIGCWGEVFISGAGMAIGYLNDPTMTAERFITLEAGGDVVYRTGDICRWLPDGNIEFYGRVDRQVKIRGQRIELSEIEDVLLRHEKIRQAAVVCLGSGDDKHLVAYIVPETSIDAGNVFREYLSLHLPAYMVPGYFMVLQQLPLNQNGKVDHRRLPEPVRQAENTAVIPPAGETEWMLYELCKEILHIDGFSITDNFLNLGGNSLKAMKLTTRIFQQTGAEVSVRRVFESKSLRELASAVSTEKAAGTEPLNAVEEQDHYPLTPGQLHLFVADQMDTSAKAYHLSNCYELKGNINIPALERSLNRLVQRHEVLRTGFVVVDHVPRQKISPELVLKLEEDCSLQGQFTQMEELIAAILSKESAIAFSVFNPPLVRAVIYKVTDGHFLFSLTLHHIICDGYSLNILFDELLAGYAADCMGRAAVAGPPLKVQYKDYTCWFKRRLDEGRLSRQRDFWLALLKDHGRVLNLPADYSRGAMRSYRGDVAMAVIDSAAMDGLTAICSENNATLFMSLIALVDILLYKYTGQTDLTIGAPMASRNMPELEGQIGYYVNMLPLSIQINGNMFFQQLLDEVKAVVLDAFENQEYPLDEVVDSLPGKAERGWSSLFNVAVILQDGEREEKGDVAGFSYAAKQYASGTSKFDLTFNFVKTGSGINICLEYESSLFKPSRIARLLRHFLVILNAVTSDSRTSIGGINYLTAEERAALGAAEIHRTKRLPADNIVSAFCRQADRHRNSIALEYMDAAFSYGYLNELSDRLAAYLLKELSVSKGDIVALSVRRSEELVIGMLGILKAGAAYMPVDLGYPADRVRYMLRESASTVFLLGNGDTFTDPDNNRCRMVKIGHCLAYSEDVMLSATPAPDDMACIIYTSGSSGFPKGIVIEHRNILNLADDACVIPLDNCSRFLQTSSAAFDAATFEIWAPLLHGSRLYIVPAEELYDMASLGRQIRKLDIDTVFLITAWFNTIIATAPEVLATVGHLLVGGEMNSPWHMNKMVTELPGVNFLHLYGPAENTTYSTCYKITTTHADNVPVGKPLSNCGAIILDQDMQPCAPGVEGEIFIYGDSLARGYLNDPELTASRFIHMPQYNNVRMYRTGDIGKLTEDHQVVFVRREDGQVKIRGHRIELQEIELALIKAGSIKEVLVMPREFRNGKELVAYFVAEKDRLSVGEVREALSGVIPAYMVPDHFLQIDSFPLTRNGKIDKHALAGIPLKEKEKKALAPARTQEEEILKGIYEKVLHVAETGLTDNFFESGGNSLKAIQLVSHIQQVFDKKISLSQIFLHPTVKEIAGIIAAARHGREEQVTAIEEQDYYEMSHFQKGLWVADRLDNGQLSYNVPVGYRLTGSLNREALEKAFRALLEKHEILRTIFVSRNGLPYQRVLDPQAEQFRRSFFVYDENKTAATAAALMERHVHDIFDLQLGPLMKVIVYVLGTDDHLLLFNIHHIITDGHSMDLLLQEICTLYNIYQQSPDSQYLPPELQYRDFSAWQNRLLDAGSGKDMRSFWLEMFNTIPERLKFPVDYPWGHVDQKPRGDFIVQEIDDEVVKVLTNISHESNASLFMTLMACMSVLFHKQTGQCDFVIAVPASIKDFAELDGQLGSYLNNLPIRIIVDKDESFADLLARVRGIALRAYEHHHYPFDRLVTDLRLTRERGRYPLLDIVMLLESSEEADRYPNMQGLQLEALDTGYHVSTVDFRFAFSYTGSRLRLYFDFNAGRYNRRRMEELTEQFMKLSYMLSSEPQKIIADIQVADDGLSRTAGTQITTSFNFDDGN